MRRLMFRQSGCIAVGQGKWGGPAKGIGVVGSLDSRFPVGVGLVRLAFYISCLHWAEPRWLGDGDFFMGFFLTVLTIP